MRVQGNIPDRDRRGWEVTALKNNQRQLWEKNPDHSPSQKIEKEKNHNKTNLRYIATYWKAKERISKPEDKSFEIIELRESNRKSE